jgi:hypothetical protein
MGDSKDLTQQAPEGTTAIVVKGPKGKEKILLKDKSGRFVKKSRPMPNTGRELKIMARKTLERLENLEASPTTGKLTRKARRMGQVLIDNALYWATYMPPEGETPDAKMVAASKQWADWYMLNFIGKPSETDEDKEDNKLAGVKFVVIQQPELMHKEEMTIEDRLKQPDKPKFIDAEIVSTNE